KVNSSRFRLSIFRSNKYIYAQIIDDTTSSTIVSASSFEKDVRKKLTKTSSIEAAQTVGKLIAERAVNGNCSLVYLDRSGYCYHGQVKALAETARASGLNF
ncbi:MAG: 50S ribosomal protein L18, partial [Burkholderiales bacterium]